MTIDEPVTLSDRGKVPKGLVTTGSTVYFLKVSGSGGYLYWSGLSLCITSSNWKRSTFPPPEHRGLNTPNAFLLPTNKRSPLVPVLPTL